MRDVPVHYLRPNHQVTTPRYVIYLDSESSWVEVDGGELHTLRLWCARGIARGLEPGDPARDTWGDGDTTTELADWVEARLVGRTGAWIYAHNLAFDLAVTRLPQELAARGWETTALAADSRSPWVRMRRRSKRITLTDSWSWLGKSMEAIGGLIGLPKVDLPDAGDDRAAWLARCRGDVMILSEAVEQLMGWWDRDELGRWTITGPACGWNAFRHTPTEWKTLIDPDPAQMRADRDAIYGGRRSVWKVGGLRAGPYAELDFRAAYPTIAAEVALPTRRYRHFDSRPVDDPILDSRAWGIAARVLVDTDTPRWPLRTKHGIFHPTGRFWTTLASPDIHEARRLGCLVQIGPGWSHQLGYQMQNWARWVLACQDDTTGHTPPAARVACKAWGRTVIGRWAAHGHERAKLGPAPTFGWGYGEGWDHDTMRPASILDYGGWRWWSSETEGTENTYPAVSAWVEAHVRVRLARVIDALGAGCLVQADTDGLIVAMRSVGTKAAGGHLVAPAGLTHTGRLNWCLDQLNPVTAPLTLRVKRRIPHLEVLGPQHLSKGGQRHYSGIPALATEPQPGRFEFRAWPSMSWEIQHSPGGGYPRPDMHATVRAVHVPGWVLADNRVIPPSADADKDGRTWLEPWSRTITRPWRNERLAEVQHPGLDGLWER